MGTEEKATTGIEGLDNVLAGGFPRNRIYLIEGDPGTGKTTIGLQFLMQGVKNGETVLYISLSETREEIEGVARSHGWSLKGVSIYEFVDSVNSLSSVSEYTVFEPSEIELGETIKVVLEQVENLKPARVVIDSLSELRLLAQDSLRYRRQILSLKQFFIGRGCTVMLLDDLSATSGDQHVRSLAHGVLRLEQLPVDYGIDRRRVRIVKVRGVRFRAGYHDLRILTGGVVVYPSLVAAEHHTQYEDTFVSSGLPKLDALLRGGLRRGTSTLFLGPVGCGKSTLVAQYAVAAAQRGESVSMFLFDEGLGTLYSRCQGLHIDLNGANLRGKISVQQIDPAQLSPGEFAIIVRDSVEKGARQVIIDSLNGYLNAMPGEKQLLLQFHELLTFLRQSGVTTLLTEGQHGMLGSGMSSPVDVSYLADTVILLRYFESQGEVRQAISIMKNRSGAHERTLREFKLGGEAGITVGEPLREFHGVLTGVPTYKGDAAPLIQANVNKT